MPAGTPNRDSCAVYGLTPQEVRYLKVKLKYVSILTFFYKACSAKLNLPPSPNQLSFYSFFFILMLLGSFFPYWIQTAKEFLDQRKNPKWRVSSYFHSSFSPISRPCGRLQPYRATFKTLHSLTLTQSNLK